MVSKDKQKATSHLLTTIRVPCVHVTHKGTGLGSVRDITLESSSVLSCPLQKVPKSVLLIMFLENYLSLIFPPAWAILYEAKTLALIYLLNFCF